MRFPLFLLFNFNMFQINRINRANNGIASVQSDDVFFVSLTGFNSLSGERFSLRTADFLEDKVDLFRVKR